MHKRCPQKLDLKYPTILIGILHLMLLAFRIFEIALDLYLLEEVVELNQITYILLILLLQLFIIISLFVGAVKRQHFFLLPWLCFTAPTFAMATGYAILYLDAGDPPQSALNFTVIGVFWSAWYLVFKYYSSLRLFAAKFSYKGYKYSSDVKELDNECGVTL